MNENENVQYATQHTVDLESLCEFLISVIAIANSGRPGVAVQMLESFVSEMQLHLVAPTETGPQVE